MPKMFSNIIILSSINNIRPNILSRSTSYCHQRKYRHYCTKNHQPHGAVQAVVGLEIHAQIKAYSKLFSRGGTNYLASPNTQLDLFDIALPGTLPILNKHCIISAIRTGLALNCTIQPESHFDRKHYYYSDLPAGYQLTQYHRPIAKNGYLDFVVTPYYRPHQTATYDLVQFMRKYEEKIQDANTSPHMPYIKRSVITQIQLEQDSAKSFHEFNTTSDGTKEDFSLVDYNRAGVALMEIVFEPDLTNNHEATSLISELIMVLRRIDTCDCQLQEGSLRVDANISLHSIDGQEMNGGIAGRVELKNLNSLRSLNRGIEYEILRQEELIRANKIVERETRTFDTKSGKSIVLRKKEQSIDYRFIPEPSLPPININVAKHDDVDLSRDEISVEELRKTLGVLPSQERKELIDVYGLDLEHISDILHEEGMKEFLLLALEQSKCKDMNIMAKFLLHAKRLLDVDAKDIIDDVSFVDGSAVRLGFEPKHLAEIVDLAEEKSILYGIGYELIKLYVFNREQRPPIELARSFGWLKINDIAIIEEHCRKVIYSMKGVSKKYARSGETRHLKLLMLKLNEISSGRISFELANNVFDDILRAHYIPAKDNKSNIDKARQDC